MFTYLAMQELLKYKSHQISPPELESILIQCPGVADVGISSISDGQGNDLPVAFVVIQPELQSKMTQDDIHNFLNPKISTYKRLRGGVEFIDEIPRNLNGKVMRNVLKELAEKGRRGKQSPRARL